MDGETKGLAARRVRAPRAQRDRASPLRGPQVCAAGRGRSGPRGAGRRAVVSDGLTPCPVCSPQLPVYRSSSPCWPCATPSFPRRTATASSTRPPPQVRPLGRPCPAVPLPGDWGDAAEQPAPQRPHHLPPASRGHRAVAASVKTAGGRVLLTPGTLAGRGGPARPAFPSGSRSVRHSRPGTVQPRTLVGLPPTGTAESWSLYPVLALCGAHSVDGTSPGSGRRPSQKVVGISLKVIRELDPDRE